MRYIYIYIHNAGLPGRSESQLRSDDRYETQFVKRCVLAMPSRFRFIILPAELVAPRIESKYDLRRQVMDGATHKMSPGRSMGEGKCLLTVKQGHLDLFLVPQPVAGLKPSSFITIHHYQSV